MGTEISKPLMGTARILFDEGGGLADLGNIPDISLDTAIKTLERWVSLDGQKVLDFTHVIGKSISLKFKLDDLDENNLARVFAGSAPVAVSETQKKVVVLERCIVEGNAQMIFTTSKGKPFTWIVHRCELRIEGGMKLTVENWCDVSFVLNVLPGSGNPTEPFGHVLIG